MEIISPWSDHMFKRIILYFFVAIFLSTIFPNVSEATHYRKYNFEINFPTQCDSIWDFSNGITAMNNNNNCSVAVWFPTRLDSEQQKIFNAKKDLSQLTADELQSLTNHLETIRKNETSKNKDFRSTLIDFPSLNVSAPAVYYTYGDLKFLDIQIISKGLLYGLTFSAPSDSFEKYENEIFIPTIASFKIDK